MGAARGLIVDLGPPPHKMAADIREIARNVLKRRVPYLSVLMAVKVLALFAVLGLALVSPARSLLLQACALVTAVDILLRIAASSSCALSPSKHGTDVFL